MGHHIPKINNTFQTLCTHVNNNSALALSKSCILPHLWCGKICFPGIVWQHSFFRKENVFVWEVKPSFFCNKWSVHFSKRSWCDIISEKNGFVVRKVLCNYDEVHRYIGSVPRVHSTTFFQGCFGVGSLRKLRNVFKASLFTCSRPKIFYASVT